MSTVVAAGHRLQFERTGSGPTLLLLHNGGTSGAIWAPQVAAFASTHDVVTVDLLGFGRSAKPELQYTRDLFVDSVAALLHELGVERLDIVGNCFGATVALRLAELHPGLVRRLVVMNVFTPDSLVQGAHGAAVRASMRSPRGARFVSWLTARAPLPRRLVGRLATSAFREAPGDTWSEQMRELYADRANLRVLGNMLANVATFTLPPQGARLPPLALLWGGANPVAPIEAMAAVEQALSPRQTRIIDGGGHMVARERPDLVNAVIAEFLDAD